MFAGIGRCYILSGICELYTRNNIVDVNVFILILHNIVCSVIKIMYNISFTTSSFWQMFQQNRKCISLPSLLIRCTNTNMSVLNRAQSLLYLQTVITLNGYFFPGYSNWMMPYWRVKYYERNNYICMNNWKQSYQSSLACFFIVIKK